MSTTLWISTLSAATLVASPAHGQAPAKTPASAPTTGAITGVVTNVVTAKPIQGVWVKVIDIQQDLSAHGHPQFAQSFPPDARTDDQGRFTIGSLLPGTYTVRIGVLGYREALRKVIVPPSDNALLEVQLRAPGSGPPVDSSRLFEIWKMVLVHYRPKEASISRATAEITGVGSDSTNRGQVPVVLFADSSFPAGSYATRVLDTLAMQGLAQSVCHQSSVTDCPESVVTTYLTLGRPRQDTPDTITASFTETDVNPALCRGIGLSMGGFSTPVAMLIRDGGEWTLASLTSMISGTIVCGHRPPEEEARYRRRAAEDSILKSKPSLIAGTYRFTVTLHSGRSIVLFSRTEKYPMNVLRNWNPDAPSDSEPIRGYDLMAVCALDEIALPGSYRISDSVSVCYPSVSVGKVKSTPDSIVLRGDAEATGTAWILLKNQPTAKDSDALRELESIVNESQEDSVHHDLFYKSGYWVVYANGRVHFRLDMRRNGVLLAAIRGERVSATVLRGGVR